MENSEEAVIAYGFIIGYNTGKRKITTILMDYPE